MSHVHGPDCDHSLDELGEQISLFISEYFQKAAANGVIDEQILMNLHEELMTKFELTESQADDILSQILSGGEGEEGEGFEGEDFPWGLWGGEEGEFEGDMDFAFE